MQPDARLVELVAQHTEALIQVARNYCHDPEEATQRALVKLALARRWPDDPAAWLYTVCRNEALQLARAESRRKRHEQHPPPERPEPVTIEPDTRAALIAALAMLPADESTAITMRTWGHLTTEQSAAALGVSPATAHRLYHRGLMKLRELLPTEEDSP